MKRYPKDRDLQCGLTRHIDNRDLGEVSWCQRCPTPDLTGRNMIETIIALTAASIIGGAAMIGLGLRKLYSREGGSFATWHKRRLVVGLGLSVPFLVALPAIAISFGLETAELSFIGLGGVVEAVLLWKQSRARAKRGSALTLARLPERKVNRLVAVLAVASAGLLLASMVVDGSINALGIGRLVGLAEVAVAVLLLGPEIHQFYEHGVQQFRSFVPWSELQSFRYLEFENTAIYTFQLQEPGWFRREVSVAVPRAEMEQVYQYLSQKLPCIGHDDRRRLPSPVV